MSAVGLGYMDIPSIQQRDFVTFVPSKVNEPYANKNKPITIFEGVHTT